MTDVMTQNAAVMSTGDDAVDWLQTSRGEQIAYLRDNADVYIEYLPGGSTGIMPSSRNEGSPFAKLEVRQAISYAMDREALVEARGFGAWTVAGQLIPEDYPGHLPDSYNASYDPAKAKELLAQAGYPNGLTADFFGTTTDRDAVVAIQSMLEYVGIHTNLEFPEAGAISNLRYDGFEGIITQVFGVYPNILQLWWYYFDSAYMYWPNLLRPQPMMDLYVQARKDVEVDAKKAEELHKMIMDDMVVIPVYNTATAHILKNNMHGTGHPNWGLGTQWLAHSAWKSKN
jgi:peptide/nickel transport system substrate-binding protein